MKEWTTTKLFRSLVAIVLMAALLAGLALTSRAPRTPADLDPIVANIDGYTRLTSVSQLKSLMLTQQMRAYWTNGAVYDMALGGETMREESTANTMAPQADSKATDDASYTDTNSQVEGVVEGDIVKTDGKYLYIQSENGVKIVQVNGGDMKVVATIAVESSNTIYRYLSEMYLAGDKLVLVINENIYETDEKQIDGDTSDGSADIAILRCYIGRQLTSYVVYDIADRAAPLLERTVSTEGYQLATRMIGNVLYFATNKYMYFDAYAMTMSDAEILPCVRDTAVDDELTALPVEKIAITDDNLSDPTQIFYGAFDITARDACDINVLIGNGSNFYMSQNAMYIAGTHYDDNYTYVGLKLHKLAIDGTSINYAATGTADGYLINQYAMDEYNGHFRIATVVWGEGNGIVVFDSAMKVVGRTPLVEKDEQIQSVRFMGDMAYMVTYLNTDPLFCIDLSDPTNPTIKGELKIPGFSQYLHPVGDGLLIGIGRHTLPTYTRDENGVETEIGAQDMGMKISLFDVRDPADPRELDVLLLGDGYTEVSYNPRALMVDTARERFAFAFESYGYADELTYEGWYANSGGLVFTVENDKIVALATLQDNSDSSYKGNSRFVAIGDTLYWTAMNEVVAYSYTSFAQLASLAY